jgi:hypothetical protein
MWTLFETHYSGVSRATFEQDLAEKEKVILLHDRVNRRLCGFSTLQNYTVDFEGDKVRVVFSGDTIVDPAYWGQSALQWAFLRNGIWQKILHPLCPVYWLLITKGYKTYLLLSRNFPEYWPRHDRPTPRWQDTLLGTLAQCRFGDFFDKSTGLLRFDSTRGTLRAEVAPIATLLLEDADIHFFAEHNPGHARGDELCCLGHIGLDLAVSYIKKALMRAWKRKR